MRYDSGQFGSFDGLDNRRTVMDLMNRLGHGLDEARANRRRAAALLSLIPMSVQGFASCPIKVSPCGVAEAYHLFIAITGVLGVPVEDAARKLERMVSKQ